ncbi:DUF3883 domain-containing protein [Candidatus Bathyarchaeota archaeon]|nr:MAG: DUF3883 domain-containing protein [Candidatus Bathyarchaeota archaeon]
MSAWLENKFCPHCGTYLIRKTSGDTYCSNCNQTINEKQKIDLNKVDKNVIDNKKNNRILGKIREHDQQEKIFNIDKGCIEYISEPNQNKVKYQFLLLMERFGLGLTKYYETFQTRTIVDYSNNSGYGYDILSTLTKSDKSRYIEVKTRLGIKPSISLTSSEFSFLVEDQSPEKWLYVVLLDRGELLGKNYDDCFEFFMVPCNKLKPRDFEHYSPSKFLLRYYSWSPVSNRCRVILPDVLVMVLQDIRENYVKLFPDRASRVMWYTNHQKQIQNIQATCRYCLSSA